MCGNELTGTKITRSMELMPNSPEPATKQPANRRNGKTFVLVHITSYA